MSKNQSDEIADLQQQLSALKDQLKLQQAETEHTLGDIKAREELIKDLSAKLEYARGLTQVLEERNVFLEKEHETSLEENQTLKAYLNSIRS